MNMFSIDRQCWGFMAKTTSTLPTELEISSSNSRNILIASKIGQRLHLHWSSILSLKRKNNKLISWGTRLFGLMLIQLKTLLHHHLKTFWRKHYSFIFYTAVDFWSYYTWLRFSHYYEMLTRDQVTVNLLNTWRHFLVFLLVLVLLSSRWCWIIEQRLI